MSLFANLLFSLSHSFNYKEAIPMVTDALIGLVAIPLVALVIVGFFGRLEQKWIGHAFGPKFQAIIGGLGAFIHELIQIVIAFCTGHSIRYTHFISLYNWRHGQSMTNIDHYWNSDNLFQEGGDFLIGIVPLYILSGLIILWQSLLMGNPFTSDIRYLPVSNYLHWSLVSPILHEDFSSAFNGMNLMVIIFLIGVIELVSIGFNFSTNECNYTFRGIIVWAVFVILVFAVIALAGISSEVLPFVTVLANFGIFIMMRSLFYLLVIAIIATPFVVINKISSLGHH